MNIPFLRKLPSKVAVESFGKSLLFPTLAGVLFVVIGWGGYTFWKPADYQVRDDGVITLSHARNLADYGSISVNPSGERVEGYSAPVQFAVFLLMYKVGGISYDMFSTVQTYMSLFFLGFIFYLFFREKPVFGLAASAASALFLTQCHSFLGWHGSGMENALTHVFFLLILLLLFQMYKTGEVKLWYGAILFLASVSRIESIWYVGPVVILFSGAYSLRWCNWRALWATLIFLGLWTGFHGLRYLYFGSLMPQTGAAQSIDVWERLSRLFDLDRGFIDASAKSAALLFSKHNGYFLFLSFPLLLLGTKDMDRTFVLTVVCAFFVLSFLSPFVFGAARLDESRTTTHLPVMCALGVSFIVQSLEKKRFFAWAIPLLFLLFFAESQVHGNVRKYLCCSISWFDKNRGEIEKLMISNDLFRPTVANPDLGIMSWHKQFNVLDLGYLGSPMLTNLRSKPALFSDFFFEFSAPDIIENHKFWACKHHRLQEDSRFRERYEPIREIRDDWLKKKCRKRKKVLSGLWIRKNIKKGADTRERRLIDALAQKVDMGLIEREIQWCNSHAHLSSCLYVARTVYRFLPELTDGNHLKRTKELLASTTYGLYGTAMLDAPRNGSWYKSAVDAVEAFHQAKSTSK